MVVTSFKYISMIYLGMLHTLIMEDVQYDILYLVNSPMYHPVYASIEFYRAIYH